MLSEPTRQPVEKEIIYGYGKRLRGPAYDRALKDTVERCGRICPKCGSDEPTLDHINPNLPYKTGELHCSKNLQILCFKCNSAKGSRPSYAKMSVKNNSRYDATEELKNRVDYSNGSAEMQVNDHGEIDFRNYVKQYVNNLSSVSKKELINSGAEVTGTNPQTTRRWLDKLTSEAGEYEDVKDPESKKRVVRRRDGDLSKLMKFGTIYSDKDSFINRTKEN